ncbi:hypothetical protein FRC03_012669 [Tulasnella sp. 419]|nr:hypothetical protein FRC03_012669 [Tulasnella sp. 419]
MELPSTAAHTSLPLLSKKKSTSKGAAVSPLAELYYFVTVKVTVILLSLDVMFQMLKKMTRVDFLVQGFLPTQYNHSTLAMLDLAIALINASGRPRSTSKLILLITSPCLHTSHTLFSFSSVI